MMDRKGVWNGVGTGLGLDLDWIGCYVSASLRGFFSFVSFAFIGVVV